MTTEQGRRFLKHALFAFLWKTALVVLLLYGAAHLFLQSDFVRHRLETVLTKQTGLQTQIRRIRATSGFDFKLYDVVAQQGEAGFSARTIRLRWHILPDSHGSRLGRITIKKLFVTFAPDENGRWLPDVLPGADLMAARLGIPAIHSTPSKQPGTSPPARSDVPPSLSTIQVRDATFRWLDGEDRILAEARGIRLFLDAMKTGVGLPILFVDCHIGELVRDGGTIIRNAKLQLLTAKDRAFLLQMDADSWGAHPPRKSSAEAAMELLNQMP